MTMTRTTLCSVLDHSGFIRAVEVDLTAKVHVHESVRLERIGGVARITVTASTGLGGAISAGLDLSIVELIRIAEVARALAGITGEAP